MPAIANTGIQVADGLQHAHDLGVVHRDVKPANLMVDDSGRVWIMDFGLAMILDAPALTRTAAPVLKPACFGS